MTPAELETYLRGELDAFPGRAALLMAEAESGRVLHAADPDVQVVSASTIKVPILCAALELCRRGELSLSQLVPIPEDRICPDTSVFEEGNRQEAGYPLWELLYWMIVLSDNTATNAVIRLLGYDVVNGWCRAHGLERTRLEREMLDWDAHRRRPEQLHLPGGPVPGVPASVPGRDPDAGAAGDRHGLPPPPAAHGRPDAVHPRQHYRGPQGRVPGLPGPRRRALPFAAAPLLPGDLHLGGPQRGGRPPAKTAHRPPVQGGDTRSRVRREQP